VREALFNILGQAIGGSTFLDAFAGTGATGLEALSRGAESVVLIEKNRAARVVISQNIKALDASPEVLVGDFFQVAKRLSKNGRRFDWVFVDPPYQSELQQKAVLAIDKEALLEKDGEVIVERDKRYPLPETIGRLSKIESRVYGETILEFYSMTKADQ
jgi:16S rRNA (guanine(966)-N(2))-methyltransferase RsmD